MFPSRPVLKAASSPISQPFKRSQLGLFGGKLKRYGNNNPFSKKKTRRTWLPNVQRKGLFSDSLGGELTVKVTTRVLRTMKKHGGLDNYLLKTRYETLGFEGTRLRILVQQAQDKNAESLLEESFQTLSLLPEVKEEATQIALQSRNEDVERLRNKMKPTPRAMKQTTGDIVRKMEGLGLVQPGELPKPSQALAFLANERAARSTLLADSTLAECYN